MNMFFGYKDTKIKYTGRFAEYNNSFTTTAPGSEITIGFTGNYISIEFFVDDNISPFPHLWVKIDDESSYEVPISRYLRFNAKENKENKHIISIIFKSSVEQQSRFFLPLQSKISFLGCTAQNLFELPEDSRKTIEFVGDSITEGVLIDEFNSAYYIDQQNRPYQDDSTATYAYLTAKEFNLKKLSFAYGAVGVTHEGCGGVPKAAVSYPYCFEGAKVNYEKEPDYIFINHGANDRGATAEVYIAEYENLLNVIRSINKNSVIICASAFCGCYPKELEQLIKNYNEKHNDSIYFIDATGYVPIEPLHPLREGHKIIAEKLIKELKNIIK